MSLVLSSKSNTSKLLAIRMGVTDLGHHNITELNMPSNQHLGRRLVANRPRRRRWSDR